MTSSIKDDAAGRRPRILLRYNGIPGYRYNERPRILRDNVIPGYRYTERAADASTLPKTSCRAFGGPEMRLVGEEAPLCRVRGVKVRFNRLAVEGDRELVAVLAVEEVEVSLVAEGFGEGDAGLLFGGGGLY